MRVYLDHNATTPLRDEVLEAMLELLARDFGNPSSVHAEGAAARARVERAREQVAACLGAAPSEITFGSGATEANNALLQGLLGDAAGHVVTTAVEHPSVGEPIAALERRGLRVTRVPVDAEGLLDPDAVADAVGEDTALVTLLWANNETGTVQPLDAIAERVKARGALLHVDATQAVGKLPVDLSRTPVDFLSCSAHKLNGPKGVGCLFARARAAPPALLLGGGQEGARRGGTGNAAGIAGFGVACELAQRELATRTAHAEGLRDRLWEGLRSKLAGVGRNGSARHALPNTLNAEFAGVDGEVLVQALDLEGVSASAGAACASGSLSPSHVLLAMGRSLEQARASLRFSLGLGVDEGQIDRTIELLCDLVPRVREAASP